MKISGFNDSNFLNFNEKFKSILSDIGFWQVSRFYDVFLYLIPVFKKSSGMLNNDFLKVLPETLLAGIRDRSKLCTRNYIHS